VNAKLLQETKKASPINSKEITMWAMVVRIAIIVLSATAEILQVVGKKRR